MTEVPPVAPVTTPEVELIRAIEVLLLLQFPPAAASASEIFWPTQTLTGPAIGAKALTATLRVTWQPVANVYVIVVDPAIEPLRMPEVEPITAFILLTLHEPPGVGSLNVMGTPIQRLGVEAIGDKGFTVTDALVVQPEGI